MNPNGHPGVYIQEIPSAPVIQGAPTAIPLFMGGTEIGEPNTLRMITSWASYTRYFGGLIWGAYTAWAVYEFFQEGGSTCYVANLNPRDADGDLLAVDIGGFFVAPTINDIWAQFIYVVIRNAAPPSVGDTSNFFTVSVMVKESDIDQAIKNPDDTTGAAQVINAFIKNNALKAEPGPDGADTWYILESFGSFTETSLIPGNGGGSSSSSSSSGSATMSLAPIQTYINTRSMFIRITSVDAPPSRPPNNFASDMTAPFSSAAGLGEMDYSDARAYLTVNPDISLLATPDLAYRRDEDDQKKEINTLLSVCEENNVFYVVDPPLIPGSGTQLDPIQGIVEFKTGEGDGSSIVLESAYGALYFPWVLALNHITGVNVPMPPSGPVLGRYASTDNAVGVHKSPAGTRDGLMRTVAGMTTLVSEADQDTLNPHGINAIRSLPGYGNAIYGARTLAVASDYTYVAIRRFVSYVERSLHDNLQALVFEPNSQALWLLVRSEVSAFLTTLWRQGALFGGTAAEAFYVVCDGSNNPPENRALGLLCVDVGLAPVYPSEFILLRITQKTNGPTA